MTAVGRVLAGSVHAVLAGDSPRSRVQFPPAYRAALIRAAGLRAWTGLNCRDRNRVALEGELAALAHLGVDAVHCVTGDHPALGSRADAAAVFDLDSTQLAELAVRAGLLTSVGESPTAPPHDQRAARLVEKLSSGRRGLLRQPLRRARAGPGLPRGGAGPRRRPLVPARACRWSSTWPAPSCSPRSPASSCRPASSTGSCGLPTREEAGVAAAVELSEELLGVPGVAGVNLSGGSAPGAELPFAAALAEIGRRLGVDAPISAGG